MNEEVEYELWLGGVLQTTVFNDGALEEAQYWAEVYRRDGSLAIHKVTRQNVTAILDTL